MGGALQYNNSLLPLGSRTSHVTKGLAKECFVGNVLVFHAECFVGNGEHAMEACMYVCMCVCVCKCVCMYCE